jgi:tetratricopeptide (TPR) repeat protein
LASELIKPSVAERSRVSTGCLVACGAILLGAVALAWSNSWAAAFHFDDEGSIAKNESIRDLWFLRWLRPPATAGETVSGRPILNLSFAINYAIGGVEVRGYRLVNVLIHGLAALVLFGIVRRTMPYLPGTGSRLSASTSAGVALAVALLWAIHPLQTAAVTYVVQRAESLAGLFILLTLYAFIRGADRDSKRRTTWFVLSVIACLLGMGTKETAAVAPLMVLLYDRTFLAGSFRSAWLARGRVHVALAATWLALAALVVANRSRGGSAGLSSSIDPWTYFLTQCRAIVHYIALSFWPQNQVFDYGTDVVENFTAVLPQALLLTAIAGCVLWALWRNRPAGLVGACFFLSLAPSSSFVPVATQVAAEHRMYLALAAVIVAVVGAVAARIGTRESPAMRKCAAGLVMVAAIALGATTFARNRVYQSSLTLWQDTVDQHPTNARARNNLGLALVEAGRVTEAEKEFLEAIALQPNHAFAHFSWGTILLSQRRWDEAAVRFRDALAADPDYVDAHVNLGRALTELGRLDEAAEHYGRALQLEPTANDARTNLAALLIKHGKIAEGEAMLREVLAASPDLAEAHFHLGLAREKAGAVAEAETELRRAIQLKPALVAAHVALGNNQARSGQPVAAEASFREAIQRDPKFTEAHFALGNLLAKGNRMKEAIDAYTEALALDPAHVQARNNLANAQLVTGLLEQAIASYQLSLGLRPNDESVRRNLEIARELLRRKSSGAR